MHRSSRLKEGAATAIAAAAIAALPDSAVAQSQSARNANAWQYGVELYVYLPSIGGALNFPFGTGGSGLMRQVAAGVGHCR
jgi:hypothetical protein